MFGLWSRFGEIHGSITIFFITAPRRAWSGATVVTVSFVGVVGRRVVGLRGWTLRFGRSVAIAIAVYDQLLGNIFLASSLLGSTGIASATGWPGRHRGRDVGLLLLLGGCSRLPNIWFGQLWIMVTIAMPFRDSRHPAGSNGFDVFAGSEQSRHLKFFCSFEYLLLGTVQDSLIGP